MFNVHVHVLLAAAVTVQGAKHVVTRLPTCALQYAPDLDLVHALNGPLLLVYPDCHQPAPAVDVKQEI